MMFLKVRRHVRFVAFSLFWRVCTEHDDDDGRAFTLWTQSEPLRSAWLKHARGPTEWLLRGGTLPDWLRR